MNYYLNIGSNVGDSRANIMRAIAKLSAGFGGCAVSSIIESEPWGFESENKFLNVGITLWTDIEPQIMLDHIHDIEKAMGTSAHRNPDGSYRDREIDIDIMAIDDLVIDTPSLTVPHRFLHQRSFFLLPMSQLNPNWLHPILNLTPAQMFANLTTPEE